MGFTATRTAQGQYFLYNDVTGEHVTVDSAEEVSAAVDAYNQGTKDKQEAEKKAQEEANAPVEQPQVDVMPTGTTQPTEPMPVPDISSAADAQPPAPVSNTNP